MIIQKILSKYFMLIMNQKSRAFTESLSYEDIVQISNFKLHYQYQYASYIFLCGYFMDLLWLHKKVIWFSRNYNLENLAVCRNYSWFNCVAHCKDPRFPQFHHIILCSGLIRQTWMIFLSIFLLLSSNEAFIFQWLEWRSTPHVVNFIVIWWSAFKCFLKIPEECIALR